MKVCKNIEDLKNVIIELDLMDKSAFNKNTHFFQTHKN